MRKILATAFLSMAFVPGVIAGTVTFGFYGITSNDPADIPAGQAQLFVDVADPDAGRVLFTFRNIGPLPMSITDIYFDDGALLGIASITNGPGVAFSQGASPGNLPAGNSISPPFVTTAGFLADSDPPSQPNGVNPNEWIAIAFDLQSGRTYGDVLSDLATGELRIGIHVQGFASGNSESFVNDPGGQIPEPGTVTLLGGGLVALGALRLRRRAV